MTHLGILFDPNIWSYAKSSKENIDKEPIPQDYLDTAIDRVAKGIGYILGKHMLDDNDSLIINNVVDLSCSVLDRLRSREWLSCWDIAAALEMTDRPVFVRLGLSVPLHEKDTNGEVIRLPTPLHRWRKKIDDYRCGDENNHKGLQVYLCPLNINTDHFSLLEINEQTKMIYYYDSMASHGIIYRKTKSIPVRRVVEEEFKYLGFGYIEVPIPQQRDGWSCGLMIIRNAKRRMMGLSVGSWNDEVNPDRVVKEVVGNC
ncbi:hypothetical protein BGZ60DRAFT_421782 [Tricladium varicosporioides]|nr:hypothetical protein BGZ60DRAFT_421782 [Hymenoscyphus varicosporioides]